MKRFIDIAASALGLAATSPLLLPAMVAIWLQDRHSPFYVAPRMGQGERPFNMIKLRSMVVDADRAGVDSTSAEDPRITRIGHFVRRYKLDELPQLWNVLRGDMSLVGPRPNVERETRLYTEEEKRLLTVRPGITDFASIVFSDEGDILAGHPDPDLGYNQLIRPWKSRLGLFYIEHASVWVDLRIIFLTAVAIVSRERALAGVTRILKSLGAEPELIEVAGRNRELVPTPPPGATEIVRSRS